MYAKRTQPFPELSRDPVAVAEFFDLTLRLFLRHVVGVSSDLHSDGVASACDVAGVSRPVLAYFAPVETHRRGFASAYACMDPASFPGVHACKCLQSQIYLQCMCLMSTNLCGMLAVGVGVGPSRGYFGRNPRKVLETAQAMGPKAIEGLLSRFRWCPRGWIFDRSFMDLNPAPNANIPKSWLDLLKRSSSQH